MWLSIKTRIGMMCDFTIYHCTALFSIQVFFFTYLKKLYKHNTTFSLNPQYLLKKYSFICIKATGSLSLDIKIMASKEKGQSSQMKKRVN
ncbi:hypothetical protein XELAEV_18001237mg [Xenopus laevis]|nr:hypothetical protein XELAEV_18001237mg [Xenopus laevis]